ncbi:Titin [Portunus trituberculatus]|uniref:Titin n=1 Tax=Portunus trituberculatus TaxID=210409 RepID=A0A5B7CFY0_PORTR|nr:Titin [Portunus trituberculatus]
MLENISLRDVGEYTCKIKQGLRAELTSAKCIVKLEDTPPRISTDLNDVHIKTSEDLTLSFEAIGYPEPKTFRWFKNGNNFRVTEYPQLIIRGADVNNAGEYRCEASNPLGSCTTRTAVVKVQDSIMMCSEEIQIIQQPTASEVYYAGDWMYLTCKVHYCKDVKFVCFLNNKVLTGNDDVVLTTSSSGNQHSCILIYHMTEEQVEKENVKQLCFKFGINGQISLGDTKIEESIYWNIEPCEDGVTWIITNSLPLTINLSHTSSNMQEINVHIKLNTELKLLQDSRKLNGSLTVQFLVHDLQELKDHIQLELYFTYKGQQYKQEMLVETPAISQQFYRGNQID